MSAAARPMTRVGVGVCATILVLTACQPQARYGEGYAPPPGGGYAGSYGSGTNCAALGAPPEQSSLMDPALGGLAGAGMGALLGNLVAGRHHNTGAILGGAALGGLMGGAGGYAYDRQGQERKEEYARQQQIACYQAANQRQQAEHLSRWNGGEPQGGGAQSGVVDTPAMVTQAQRMLVALNYFNGPVDGNLGQQTRQAVMRFQGDHGLAQTGDVTQQTLGWMRAAL